MSIEEQEREAEGGKEMKKKRKKKKNVGRRKENGGKDITVVGTQGENSKQSGREGRKGGQETKTEEMLWGGEKEEKMIQR